MKVVSSTAIALLCSSLAVHALPGLQQPRRAFMAGQSFLPADRDPDTQESMMQATAVEDAPTTTSIFTAPTAFTVIDGPSDTAVPFEPITEMQQADSRQDRASLLLPVLDPLSGILGDGQSDEEADLEDQFDDDYDESCDDDDEYEDYEDALDWRRRDGEENYGCWSALEEVLLQVGQIKTMLDAPKMAKRELADFTDEHDEGLTSEQKAALYTLVKGVDGYQTSVEGATDIDQTEQETQQAGMQASNSTSTTAPVSPAWSPTQVESLLVLLDALLQESKEEKPSGATLGSQAGQAVSEAGYTAPSNDAGSGQMNAASSSSTSNTQEILAKLSALRSQEKDLMSQLQAGSNSSPSKAGSPDAAR